MKQHVLRLLGEPLDLSPMTILQKFKQRLYVAAQKLFHSMPRPLDLPQPPSRLVTLLYPDGTQVAVHVSADATLQHFLRDSCGGRIEGPQP